MRMSISLVYVHEMFHPAFRAWTWFAAIAQVVDEARVADRQAPELGPGHLGLAQKALDPAYQHGRLRGDSAKE
jgi:hypothetical protein